MEARGNAPSYPAQGRNFVRASLNYGPLASLPTQLFGFISQKQSSFDQDFHTYALEWTPDWMRFYVDSRLKAMMNLKITGKGGKDFFKRGNYPDTATNGSSVVFWRLLFFLPPFFLPFDGMDQSMESASGSERPRSGTASVLGDSTSSPACTAVEAAGGCAGGCGAATR